MRVAPNIYRNSCSDWARTLIKKSRSCSVSNHKGSICVSVIVFGRKNKLALSRTRQCFWAHPGPQSADRGSEEAPEGESDDATARLRDWVWLLGRKSDVGQQSAATYEDQYVPHPSLVCVCVCALMMRHNCMSDYTRGCVYVYTPHIRLVLLLRSGGLDLQQ